MKSAISLLLSIFLFASTALAQIKQTENTLKLANGAAGDKAVIADMEWLAGSWSGSGLGGHSEEIWSQPKGGVMMGMYRMLNDDKPVFYELLTLSESEGTLLIRLKHFHSNFVGWEEKDKTVDFKFVKKDDKRIYFEGMTFEPIGKEKVNIYLAIKYPDGKVKEEIFKYSRTQ